MRKKVLGIIKSAVLIGVLAIGVMVSAKAVMAEEPATHGYCGDPGVNDGHNIKWSYDSSTKTLTISGSGNMENYKSPAPLAPWKWFSEYGLDIEKVVFINVNGDITSIGDYAFYECRKLESITIPESVTYIGTYAFNACFSITSLNIPSGITTISPYAFSGCKALTSVSIPDSVEKIAQGSFQDCDALTSITILLRPSQPDLILI